MTSMELKPKAIDAVSNTEQEITVDQPEHVEETLPTRKPVAKNAETKPNLKALRRKLVSAKRVFRDRLNKSFHVEDGSTRLYHVWQGNNVFLLGGRLICGPDPRGLVLTTMAILMSSWSFGAYVANDDDSYNYGPKIICCIIFTIIVVVNLGMVSMSDPGIVPRESEDRGGICIEGIEMKPKYCRICKVYPPPRTQHCVVCDNCVEKFDHHCPWIGQCIGLRNYKFYITFLLMGLVLFAYIFAFSFRKIQSRMSPNDAGFIQVLPNCPQILALTSFTFTASCLLAALASYNLYLLALNQTSYEKLHEYYASSQNPYDRGFWGNIMEVFCGARPPPKVDFRAEVIRHDNSCSISMMGKARGSK